MQEFQPFCRQLAAVKIDHRPSAARLSASSDETKPDRVFGSHENDGGHFACSFGSGRRRVAYGDDHGDPSVNQFGCERRQPIELPLRPAVYDRYILALDIAAILQTLAKSTQTVGTYVRRCRRVDETDYGHPRLLRARRERPRRRAKQRDELAAVHSITSSARASFETKRLRGLEVDYQLVLGRRLHRQIGRLRTPEDAVDVSGRQAHLIDGIIPIADQTAGENEGSPGIDRWQFMPRRQRENERAVDKRQRARRNDQTTIRRLREARNDPLDLASIAQINRAHVKPNR